MAGGHFYLGGGTAVQQATGMDDSPEEMAKYLGGEPRLRPGEDPLYAEGCVEHFDWLESLGFEFERSFYPHKAVVQPGTEGVMFTGNEKCWPFKDLAKPAPRGHKPPVQGDPGGASIVVDLALKKLEALGVEVRYDTGATALVVDGDSVAGATWKRYDETGAIRRVRSSSRRAGSCINPEMVETYAPQLSALFRAGWRSATPTTTGSASAWASPSGGVADHMEGAFFTGPFYPPGEILQRHHGEQARPALRQRGRLPLADVGVRLRPARPDG